MISIIIPVYNGAEKIVKTLQSIQNQSYQDFEIIIVNDGSSDGVENVCANYLKNIQSNNHYIFINQNNAGAPAARNRGWQEARGQYLFFCDADAILAPLALEKMQTALDNHPEASYAYPSFRWGKKLFKLEEFKADKLKNMPYIHTMALIRREDFPKNGWDIRIKKLQDWDLWLTMLEEGKIGVWIPEILFSISPGGTISSWLPAFAYKLFPFLPAVKKYKEAIHIVKEKHGLI
jgi:glycosyltransferase involved in cell wall biosynthesis